MEQKTIDKYCQWFKDFVADYYKDCDEYVANNLKLKDNHTWRVCGEMKMLTDGLGLDESDSRIAETIALFHDVGRFEQFKKYRTYKDPESENHCLLGLRILKEKGILSDLNDSERKLIETAIEFHGAKDIPNDLTQKEQFYTKLIRDADKLDIYFLVIGAFRDFHEDPANFKLEIEYPDEPRVSESVINAMMKNETIDYNILETMNDAKLLTVGWVYDINFIPSLRRINEQGYAEKLMDLIPDLPKIDQVKQHVREYISGRLACEK